jgi:hypothetical protein
MVSPALAAQPRVDYSIAGAGGPTGAVQIDDGMAYTKSPIAQVALSFTDSSPGESLSTMSFSTNGDSFSTPTAYSATGTTLSLPSGDGTKTVYARVTDSAGNSTTATAQILLDTTPPALAIASPATASTLNVNQATSLIFTAVDSGAGVNEGLTRATLDGNPIGLGGRIDGFFLAVGQHAITVDASDLAGNTTTVTIPFQVEPTLSGLAGAITRAKTLGLINATHASQLQGALAQAHAAQQRGRWKQQLAELADAVVLLMISRGHGIDTTFDDRASGWVLGLAQVVAAPHVGTTATGSTSSLVVVVKRLRPKKRTRAKPARVA